jgi:hypothetical protein
MLTKLESEQRISRVQKELQSSQGGVKITDLADDIVYL